MGVARQLPGPYTRTMESSHHLLSAKEKETLRLLLRGHDAKSSARELGLSVHTVNERLRDARRKLGVTSSREAARLLREMEGQPPELLGDKGLGDAWPSHLTQASDHAASPGKSRRAGWIIGGSIMSLALAFYALASLSGSGQSPTVPLAAQSAVLPTPASEQAAIDAARRFMAMLDRDDWTASWQATHKSFQLLNTVEWWSENSQRVRGAFGTAQSRELATVDFSKVPPDGYWKITFKASYSKKGSALETVSLASENGEWKVAGIIVE